MSLYILIGCELIALLFSYYYFDNDIISPPVISMLVILVGTISVIPSVELWNVIISDNTITVVCVGIICCIIGSCIAKTTRKKNSLVSVSLRAEPVHFHRSIEIITAFLTLVITVLYLIESIRVGSSYGGVGLGSIAYMKYAYMSSVEGDRMNIFIRQGFKIVMVLAYISCFVLANNVFVSRERLKKNISYIIAFICGCAITIFSGSRAEILRILSAFIFCYSILLRTYKGWNCKYNRRSFWLIVRRVLPFVVFAIGVAFVSRSIVKTKGTGASEISNIVSYFSYYVGSPIQVLNIKLNYFTSTNELWFGTNSSIPEFVHLGSLDYGGNVSTIFGSCITYNGLIKMVAYLLSLYFIGTYFYYKLYDTKPTFNNNLHIIIYAYCYFIFTMSYYSMCTSILLDFSNLIILFLIVLSYRFLFKTRVRIR